MSYTLTVPADYGYVVFKLSVIVALSVADPFSSYVILTAALSTFVSNWHGYQTGKFRGAAKVKCKHPLRCLIEHC